MSQLDQFDGAKIIDARARRHVEAAAELLRTEMKRDFDQLRTALTEARDTAANNTQHQAALTGVQERVGEIENKLLTFLPGDDEEQFEFSEGDGPPRPTPEIISARLDHLEERLSQMAERPQAASNPAEPPVSEGGFSTWVTHAALTQETQTLVRRDEIDGLKNELLAEVRRIVTDAGQIADQATRAAPDTFADVSEFPAPEDNDGGGGFPRLRRRGR